MFVFDVKRSQKKGFLSVSASAVSCKFVAPFETVDVAGSPSRPEGAHFLHEQTHAADPGLKHVAPFSHSNRLHVLSLQTDKVLSVQVPLVLKKHGQTHLKYCLLCLMAPFLSVAV